MSWKLNCFIRTTKQLQACPYVLSPFSRTAVKSFTLGNNGHKNTVRNNNLRQLLFYSPPFCLQSSIRGFSQDVPSINTEREDPNEQKTASALFDDDGPIPAPVTVKDPQHASDFLTSAREDSSAIEENDERSASRQFFDELRKCTSPCDVLDLVARFPVSEKYVSNSLATMWMLTKKLSEDQKRYEKRLMFEHPQFSQVCQSVMNEAKFMWRDDLAYSFLAVVRLGIPQSTRLVQTLLRVCQERLNEFDDRCLSIVATTLQGMEKNKNVDALQIGLQLVVEQRIPKISNMFMLQTMMKCIGKDAPLTLKKKLESKALSQMHQFTLPNAQHMFGVLAEMNHRSLPILEACSNKIIENIQGIPFWPLLNVLRSCRDLHYRNSALYYTISDYAATAFYMWDIKQVVLFLLAFENLSFRPVHLMDKFAEKVMSRPESLNMRDTVSVLKSYSLLNHTPKGQKDRFLEALNSALKTYLSRISNADLLRAVYSFCIFGYLPQPALDQLLQDEILHDLVTSDGQNVEQNERMLHAINVCLELDGNSLTKRAALPTDKLPSPALDFLDVQEVLLTLLGDGSLFRENVQLANGYNLDFEILMDANRSVVMPNTDPDQLGDNSNIQRIALLCAPVSAFCVDSRHPRGRLAMKMRHLRLLGYRVILIHYQEFQKLKKEEAHEFLKGEIFSAETSSPSN
ncbi:FAST kinase domain-containing protein 2, mitochondrial [Anolis carolinensis]|uniref:FAST kinase domains 2 n=1 Tax=Anolis carolinensis TaxID=28377 RepID=H9GFE7_ANOCA|nr:PREDICTED: FAST kinase domain-containing protein 2, mitochondrial [Anolis carolinensis]|eukprot:XP_008113136.1 PREDICTED: FAST kinase domain-containing protein 2, mitochondrial [Anolis carolinensis]